MVLDPIERITDNNIKAGPNYPIIMKFLYTIEGIVKEGNRRGQRLGFPTMNMAVEQAIPEGVYISQAVIDETQYNSLTFVGKAKTFNETAYHAETYVLDFDKDLYGQVITVNLLKKIRENQKFKSEQELIRQMSEDKKTADKFFDEL